MVPALRPMTGCNRQDRVNTYFDQSAPFWNDIYALTDVYALIQQERKRLVLDLVDGLSLPPEAPVLEIGCGAGHLAVELARRGSQVSAIDSARGMIAPRINPAVVWMKQRLIKAIAGARGLRAEALCRTHSMAQLDTALRKAGLEKHKGTCIGFGPFTFFNMPLLPHRQGFKLHRRLPRLAHRRTPILPSAGAQ